MKNLGKLFALLGLFLLVNITESKAQISFSLGLRFAPAWAPVEYAHHTRYYYIPQLDCYYDAVLGGYYFHDQDGDDWFFTRTLPDYFQGFDFYSCPKVELDYFGDRPFEFFRDRRFEYFHEYHPDGLIPYYHHDNYRFDRDRGGYINREFDRDHRENRENYNQGNNWDRRNQNTFNQGQNRYDGNNYNYSNRRGQYANNNFQNHFDGNNYRDQVRPQNIPAQISQPTRNWSNGERNPVIVRNDHFHEGGNDRGGFRRNSFN